MYELSPKGLRLFEYRFRLLLAYGRQAFSKYTIHKSCGAYYLYHYVPMKKNAQENQKKRVFESDFWKFIDGDQSQYNRFLKIYQQYLLQFFWMTKTKSACLGAVPRSSPEKKNVFKDISKDLSKENLFAYTVVTADCDYIVRIKDMDSIRSGAKHSVNEIKNSLAAGTDVTGKTIILLDDVVNSGKTAKACKEVLIEAGAKQVYVLCMFACRDNK